MLHLDRMFILGPGSVSKIGLASAKNQRLRLPKRARYRWRTLRVPKLPLGQIAPDLDCL